jgi:hypothetical protein
MLYICFNPISFCTELPGCVVGTTINVGCPLFMPPCQLTLLTSQISYCNFFPAACLLSSNIAVGQLVAKNMVIDRCNFCPSFSSSSTFSSNNIFLKRTIDNICNQNMHSEGHQEVSDWFLANQAVYDDVIDFLRWKI